MEYLWALILIIGAFAAFFVWKFFTKKSKVNEIINDKVVLKIEVPRKNEKTPLAAEQMFASLHGLIRQGIISEDHFSFEIASSRYGIYFLVVISKSYQRFFEGQIYAQYPDANIAILDDYTRTAQKPGLKFAMAELALEKEIYLPIRTFNNFEVDPLASITSALAGLKGDDQVWIQILIRPVSNFWQKSGKDFVNSRKNQKQTVTENGTARSVAVPLEAGEQDELAQIETKSKKLGFITKIRILAMSNEDLIAQTHLGDAVSSFKQFQTGHLNSFILAKDKKNFLSMLSAKKEVEIDPLKKYTLRYLSSDEEDVLNTEELASVLHLPNFSVETPNIVWAASRRLPYQLNIPTKNEQDVRLIGMTDYHNTFLPFGIKREDRRRHMYILGKTGTGKSTLMKNMIISDIRNGEGVCFIDPHGQDIEDILNYIPPNRIGDVVYLDPSDLAFPIGLNLLELKNDEQRDLVADGVVEVFKKHFDSWGPRLQYILHNTILTLLFAQNTSLLGVQRILRDRGYRKFILKQLKDPILQKFWDEEFEDMQNNQKLFTEAVAPIQNKIGRFLSSAMIRNIVGQVKSSIDLEEIMNNQKILLVNLSQGKIGEENTALLGGMLVTRIQSTAMQRVHIPEKDRKDFYLYIDEFQNFATPAFAKILSEARKYKLNLIMAHQYIAQLTEEVRDAVFGNAGSILSFVVGPQDGLTMQREFAPFVTQDDLISLERYHFILKLMINGEQSKPFTSVSFGNMHKPFGFGDNVIALSREKYAKEREVVEDKIKRWSEGVYNKQGNLVPKAVLEQNEANRLNEEAKRNERGDDRRPQYNQNQRPYQPRQQQGGRPQQGASRSEGQQEQQKSVSPQPQSVEPPKPVPQPKPVQSEPQVAGDNIV